MSIAFTFCDNLKLDDDKYAIGPLLFRQKRDMLKMEILADSIHVIPQELINTHLDDMSFWVSYFSQKDFPYQTNYYHDERVCIKELLDDLEYFVFTNLLMRPNFIKYLVKNMAYRSADLHDGKFASYTGKYLVRVLLRVTAKYEDDEVKDVQISHVGF